MQLLVLTGPTVSRTTVLRFNLSSLRSTRLSLPGL